MLLVTRKSESKRHATQKEAKCYILTQNHSFRQPSLLSRCHDNFLTIEARRSYGRHDFNCSISIHSVFKFKQYACACIYINTQYSLGFLYNVNAFWYTTYSTQLDIVLYLSLTHCYVPYFHIALTAMLYPIHMALCVGDHRDKVYYIFHKVHSKDAVWIIKHCYEI